MISEEDKDAIARIAKRYNVTRVLLFGSCLDASRQAQDIDLGVEGIAPSEFFRFYGDLIFAVSKPVDLIDLSIDTKFARLVKQEGVPIHG